MVNINVWLGVQFGQFRPQELRGEVLGDGGQVFQIGGEGGLGDEVFQGKRQFVALAPPGVADAGVPGIGQVVCAAILPQDKARGGLGMRRSRIEGLKIGLLPEYMEKRNECQRNR